MGTDLALTIRAGAVIIDVPRSALEQVRSRLKGCSNQKDEFDPLGPNNQVIRTRDESFGPGMEVK